jgi:hypothetical protein
MLGLNEEPVSKDMNTAGANYPVLLMSEMAHLRRHEDMNEKGMARHSRKTIAAYEKLWGIKARTLLLRMKEENRPRVFPGCTPQPKSKQSSSDEASIDAHG